MNEVTISTATLPVINYGDYLVASEPFMHIERVAPFNVLIYVTAGCIYVTEDEQDYAVGAGELIFLKQGVHHYGKRRIEAGTSWYYIHFYTDPINASYAPYASQADMDAQLDLGEWLRYSAPLPKKLTGLAGSELEGRLRDTIAFLHDPKPLRRWSANLRLAELLTLCAFPDAQDAPSRLSDDIAAYLQQHAGEPLVAETLEKHFLLSYRRMATVFKRDRGITMKQYHATLRMQTARKLLRSTSLSVGEIADRLGFADQLYFSRCFHESAGMSPTAFRRKIPFSV